MFHDCLLELTASLCRYSEQLRGAPQHTMALSTEPLSGLKDGVLSVCSAASDNPALQSWLDYRAAHDAGIFRTETPSLAPCIVALQR